MSTVRNVLAVLSIVLLTAGWLGAALAGIGLRAADWAVKMDGPQAGPVRLLALVLLLVAIVLAFVPAKEEPS